MNEFNYDNLDKSQRIEESNLYQGINQLLSQSKRYNYTTRR